jgi:hypothetical protein
MLKFHSKVKMPLALSNLPFTNKIKVSKDKVLMEQTGHLGNQGKLGAVLLEF